MPFLTLTDPNAKITGSRDPLGVQAVWTLLGRRVVGNLTTVSTSVRDFTATMLGYALVERLDRADSEVEVFLRWEQWAAYSRVHVHEKAFQGRGGDSLRGIERVRERLAKNGPCVIISAARQHQILSNQKTYGLWGLYSMPSRDSGIVEPKRARLTPDAREFVEAEYWPRLRAGAGQEAKKLLALVERQTCRVELAGPEHRPLVRGIAAVLAPPSSGSLTPREHGFYTDHLLHRTPTQERAVRTMPAELSAGGTRITPALVEQWAARAGKQDEQLAAHLRDIIVAESVMAPAVWLFSWLLGQDRRGLQEIAADVKRQWGNTFARLDVDRFLSLRGLFGEAAGKRRDSDAYWLAVATALQAGDSAALIRALCDLSAAVMRHRGGAAWITLENEALRVHAREAPRRLLEKEELPGLWEHSYFLDSLAVVALTLQQSSPASA